MNVAPFANFFANGAFSTDRQAKARHNKVLGVLCDDEQPKGGIR